MTLIAIKQIVTEYLHVLVFSADAIVRALFFPLTFQSMSMANSTASPQQPIAIEITIVSAQGLRNAAFFPIFWKRLKPYATVAPSTTPCHGPLFGGRIEETEELHPVYATRVDDRGGTDPRWNEMFRIPVETSFLVDARSSICLRVYSRGFARRGSLLGWCRIPAEDMVMSLTGKVGYLSYRLRNPIDGTRGHGIVNVAVKLDRAGTSGFTGTYTTGFTALYTTGTVIGFPVNLPRPTHGSTCKAVRSLTGRR